MMRAPGASKSISVQELLAELPGVVDLTDADHEHRVRWAAEQLLEDGSATHELLQLEADLLVENDGSYTALLLAIKLALSKSIVDTIDKDLDVPVVFAVYKENKRMLTKAEHPHGEDLLRRKMAQLEWLLGSNENISWQLIIVDDGCPLNSGKIAERIINEEGYENAKVLYLQDAIEERLPIASGLGTPNDSRKGGSILYGMWHAIQKSIEKEQVIIYTDADLSTHLGQIGLLLDPIMQGSSVAIGSRRETNSVVIKKGTRNDRGKLFIYLWKRLIPELDYIIDTQCGFKAFSREMALKVIGDMIEKQFAFDIELLLKAELLNKNSIAKVPIAWIDSEAASTTTDLQPYLPMLKAISAMYRKYLPQKASADQFAHLVETMDQQQFDRIVANIPKEITDREPFEFAEFDGVRAGDLLVKE